MIQLDLPEWLTNIILLALFLIALVVILRISLIALRFFRKLVIVINAIVEMYPILLDIGKQFNDEPGYFKNLVATAQQNTMEALRVGRENKEEIHQINERLGRLEKRLSAGDV